MPEATSTPAWPLRILLLSRPFTLIPPIIGILTGAIAACGATSRGFPTRQVLIGAGMAAALNAASNIWNQLCDIDIDRINKPHRLLVTGAMSQRAAGLACIALYGLALGLAWMIDSGGGHECFAIVTFTALLTYAYSGKPFRWRRFGWRANLAIALPRGLLLKVAGWSTVAPVFGDAEPWCLGAVFMMFLMGATTTKDLDDIEGDTAGGVQNIAVKMGRAAAIRMVAPFFIVPWLVLPLLGWLGILTPGIGVLTTLGVILAAYGAFVVRLLFRVHEEDSTHFENHIAWRHMYGLMMVAQVGSSVIYHI